MELRYEYLLVVAKELNISNAAKILHMTQQGLSNHIKVIEEYYGAKLFYRKPSLKLTPIGERVIQTIKQIQLLENNLKKEIQDIEDGESGVIRMVVPQSRIKLLMPQVLSEYCKKYPKVKVELNGGLTADSQHKLQQGNIDMFIGINPLTNPLFEFIPILREEVFILGTRSLCEKYIKNFDGRISEIKKGFKLKELSRAPFIGIHETTPPGSELIKHFKKIGLEENFRAVTNDFELLLLMAMQGEAFTLCTDSMLRLAREIYKTENLPENELFHFPIIEIDVECRLYLVHSKDMWKPKFMRDFIDIFVKKNTQSFSSVI